MDTLRKSRVIEHNVKHLALPRLAVLVNSCDKFEDCWEPFFILWNKFGIKNLEHSVYLNTENKKFASSFGLTECPIHSLQVCANNGWAARKPPSWSWCLSKALASIPEDLVLYLQEDYFLTKTVDEKWLCEALLKMAEYPEIGCIHMTDIGIRKTLPDSDVPGLLRGDPRDWYYVSCQAAVWRKTTLGMLIREHENAWQFERWASKRARWLGSRFYVPDIPTQAMPIDYVKTGIIQGQWFNPVVPLFRENGIDVDFSRRGFYEGKFGRKARIGWPRRQWRRVRYNAKAFAARYIWPPKSLFEVLSMRLGHLPNDIHREQA